MQLLLQRFFLQHPVFYCNELRSSIRYTFVSPLSIYSKIILNASKGGTDPPDDSAIITVF